MQWYERDTYNNGVIIPQEFDKYMGPHGIATVRAYDDGKTSKGWGAKKFMDNYAVGKFNTQIALVGITTGRWNFAFVMRSLNLVCVDIDGKNGGLENIHHLGFLPPTLAETSKSGNGFHLFYDAGDTWDTDRGFGKFNDRISVVPGVDIRAVGCVYHWPQQMWNQRRIVPLPMHLMTVWDQDDSLGRSQTDQILQAVQGGDDDELMLIQHMLLEDLARPIPDGRRNTTLYAIGVKMMTAEVADWEDKVFARGIAVGLDRDECNKIVSNIVTYK